MNQHVLIRDKNHPWYGHTGTLTDEQLPTGQYVVKLDNGMSAGCDFNQLEWI